MLANLRSKLPYYGWIIVAASLCITTLTYGVQYSFGVFLKPLEAEFGWTRATTSWVPSIYTLSRLAFAFFTGWFTDRYGPKVIVLIGGFFLGLGLVFTSYLNASWQLYLYYCLMVSLGVSVAYTPILTTVQRWFVNRRGLALGIVTAGIGLGTVIIAPLARYLISEYGWRTSYLIIGLVSGIIVVVAALFLKKQPAETETPFQGETTAEREQNTGTEPEGFTLAQALRTRTLWLLLAMTVFCAASAVMVMYHLVAYAEDMGIPEMTAATFLSIVGATCVVGRLSGGIASDRFGTKKPLFFSLLLQGIMMLWLSRSTEIWMLYLFAAIWGFSYGGIGPLIPSMMGEIFGLRHIGSILGLTMVEAGIGGTIGPALAGYIADTSSGYPLAFFIGAILAFIAAIILIPVKAPGTKEPRY